MEIASAPTTPESSSSPHLLRRSFTAPIRSTGFSKASEPFRQTEEGRVETLFTHTAGRIVSFTSYPSTTRRHSSLGYGRLDQQEEPVGSLPWASTTETTIAAGPLRIYRALGSVAFLNSGTTLRPILAKSQCWCVDGDSKFVLRITQNTYYRIELPNLCSEEKEKVKEFKKVLAEVLQYEVTACPFKRGFTVDLPEPPKTPIRKRPWRPKQQVQPLFEQDFGKPKYPHRPAIIHPRSREVEPTEDIAQSLTSTIEPKNVVDDLIADFGFGTAESTYEHGIHGMDDLDLNLENLDDLAFDEPDTFKTPTRPKSLRIGRTVTAPPQLILKPTAPSNTAASMPIPPELKKQSSSLSSSGDSFHSFHSPISPLPPSPPYSDPPFPTLELDKGLNLGVPRLRSHIADMSEFTLTGDSELWDLTGAEPTRESASNSSPFLPKTPALVSDIASEDHWSEPVNPQPPTELRRREKRLTCRSYSPLPSPVNLYSPSTRLSGHHLTTAILQKTCSMLLGPPAQLVALMLNIAAKITNSIHRGATFGYRVGGQKIPCSWDFSDADEGSEDLWVEDDYGVSLGKLVSSKSEIARETEGSWEID